ncbi:hypothetical protein [Burkholderia sp. NRF60-BP8]|uniref:hypothetical protein n=1 Tax=Burkholderia sp. NRF60-BP8 TaxID=1637853 RepID=UPI001F3980A1|nr:hypothetical protein [Burkholderia sp. NRF60-BP8]
MYKPDVSNRFCAEVEPTDRRFCVLVEMPDHQADRVLRSIEQNHGQLSNVLAKEMPVLQQPGIWPAIVDAVAAAFRDGESVNVAIADRYRPERPSGQ